MSQLTICVYGASRTVDDIYIRETERLGKEIGSRGHTLVFGGGSTGMMGACARGVKAAGGRIIGVIPSFMSAYEALYGDCDEFIETETMSQRKLAMETRANAYIITPGGIGTMDEFFEILTLVSLDRVSAPIIIYNIEGYYDDLIRFMDSCTQKGFIRNNVRDLFRVCTDPEEALDIIEYFA